MPEFLVHPAAFTIALSIVGRLHVVLGEMVPTRDEVAGLVEESHREGLLDAEEGRLLVGALKFEERDTGSVLLALDRLGTVGASVTPHELEQLAGRTGYSRVPVAADADLIGYLHVKDALAYGDARRHQPVSRESIRPLPGITRTDRLRTALATMQRAGAHLARVTTPEGRLVGVVTLEDVLEELVGEIRDEAAATAPPASA